MKNNNKINMRNLLLLGLVFQIHTVSGQVAIIQDKDGFTNVRSKPTVDSEIVYKLKENEVFFYYEEPFGTMAENTDWKYVMIPQNKFSIQLSGYGYIYGYIHKSRLKPISQLENIIEPDQTLKFNITKVNVNDKREGNTMVQGEKIYLINGVGYYGVEIGLERSYDISSFEIIESGQVIPQSPILYLDLYNISFTEGEYDSNSDRFKTYINGEFTFIQQECADGAGYYQIVWVINQSRIIQRLVGWIY